MSYNLYNGFLKNKHLQQQQPTKLKDINSEHQKEAEDDHKTEIGNVHRKVVDTTGMMKNAAAIIVHTRHIPKGMHHIIDAQWGI